MCMSARYAFVRDNSQYGISPLHQEQGKYFAARHHEQKADVASARNPYPQIRPMFTVPLKMAYPPQSYVRGLV